MFLLPKRGLGIKRGQVMCCWIWKRLLKRNTCKVQPRIWPDVMERLWVGWLEEEEASMSHVDGLLGGSKCPENFRHLLTFFFFKCQFMDGTRWQTIDFFKYSLIRCVM